MAGKNTLINSLKININKTFVKKFLNVVMIGIDSKLEIL